jgi:hypothetical protein
VLAERELETKGEVETFYRSERHKWSERLRHALDILITNDSVATVRPRSPSRCAQWRGATGVSL